MPEGVPAYQTFYTGLGGRRLSSLRRSAAICPEWKHGNAKGRQYGTPVWFRHEPSFEVSWDGYLGEWPPNLVAAQTFLSPPCWHHAKLFLGIPQKLQT